MKKEISITFKNFAPVDNGKADTSEGYISSVIGGAFVVQLWSESDHIVEERCLTRFWNMWTRI